MPAFSVKLLAVVLLAGLLFGFVGRLFIKLVSLLKDFYSRYFKKLSDQVFGSLAGGSGFSVDLEFQKVWRFKPLDAG